MHGAGNQFLTGSALAIDQNRAAGGGDGADGLLQLFERWAGADDVVERVACSRVAPQREVLTAERDFRKRARDGQFDLVDKAGTLADVIARAARLHRLHSRFVVIDRSHQDYRGFGRNLVGVTQDFDAVHARHFDVSNNHVEQRTVDLAFGQLATGDGFHLVAIAAQGNIEKFTDRALVVTDENVTHADLLPLPRQPAPVQKFAPRRK